MRGGYDNTYGVTSLIPEVKPLNFVDGYLRTPFDESEAGAATAYFEVREEERSLEDHDPPYREAGLALFKLSDPHWFRSQNYRVVKYAPATLSAVQHTLDFSLPRACDEQELGIRVPNGACAAGCQVALVYENEKAVPQGNVVTEQGLVSLVQEHESLLAAFKTAESVLRIHVQNAQQCSLRGVTVQKEAGP